MARGGEVLVPGPQDAPAQVIDVRDMASWMIGLFEQAATGAFHAASPTPVFTWRQELTTIANAVAPAGTTLTWVDAGFLRSAGLPDGALPCQVSQLYYCPK